MLQKKICMLGSFSVGKTSLVKRYVHSIFSEAYKTTIGVKIDKKEVEFDGKPVKLMLWDIHGDDEYQRIRTTHLRGMGGYFLVVDPTRPESLKVGRELEAKVRNEIGEVPFLLILNKADLKSQWTLDEKDIASLEADGWRCHETSAKTGDGVEEAFLALTEAMVGDRA